MSLFAPTIQVVSDLHLETPIGLPSYASFKIPIHSSNLFLLGDIGLVKDDALFNFLRKLLRNRSLHIFYLLGNHEPYQLSLSSTVERMRNSESECKLSFGGRFIFLNRDRYDLSSTITILGCTLWSDVEADQAADVAARLTDFNDQRGIRDCLEAEEPHRQVIVATHHCPTKNPRALDPQHVASPISSGFTSDLSNEYCWTCPAVRLWAFGHTHYSCSYYDDKKLVISNQKGYHSLEKQNQEAVKDLVVIEAMGQWQISAPSPNKQPIHTGPSETNTIKRSSPENKTQTSRLSLLLRAADRLKAFRRTRPASSK
ncbi:hypothetical protein EJ04DRAFT_545477 [Polyplosphaeria fusca]|uniref:Calcineurin-like phosphoesterase domain-containing protein n=1 Tax=Polyplosphaeria fusca TaxID=682080 RepID=A0A9P4UY22_9PLEO|nr:hypothetical protein EJ04DRAFT_545477 [Polyplosphaeria fusca]